MSEGDDWGSEGDDWEGGTSEGDDWEGGTSEGDRLSSDSSGAERIPFSNSSRDMTSRGGCGWGRLGVVQGEVGEPHISSPSEDAVHKSLTPRSTNFLSASILILRRGLL